MKKCRVLLLFLLVSACGFQPLYVEKKHNNAWYFSGDFDTSITREMSQIKVAPIEERFGQIGAQRTAGQPDAARRSVAS